MLSRERYLPAAGEDLAQWMSVCYIDAGLTRLERFQTSGASDEYHGFEQRTSPDNGRTWTERETVSGIVQQLDGGGIVSYPAGIFIDLARAAAATRCACAVSGPACRSIPSTGARTGIPTTTTSSPRLTTDPKRCSDTRRGRTSTPITHSIPTSARPTVPISGSRSASRPTARRICHWSRTPVRPRARTPAAAWSSCAATQPRRASGKRPTSSIWGRSAPHAGC